MALETGDRSVRVPGRAKRHRGHGSPSAVSKAGTGAMHGESPDLDPFWRCSRVDGTSGPRSGFDLDALMPGDRHPFERANSPAGRLGRSPSRSDGRPSRRPRRCRDTGRHSGDHEGRAQAPLPPDHTTLFQPDDRLVGIGSFHPVAPIVSALRHATKVRRSAGRQDQGPTAKVSCPSGPLRTSIIRSASGRLIPLISTSLIVTISPVAMEDTSQVP